MSTTKRFTRGLMLLVAMSAIMALVGVGTAVAENPTTGLAVFQGKALIGDPIDSKTEDCDEKSEGLNFPVVEDEGVPAFGKSKTRCWGFESEVCIGVAVVGGAPEQGDCTIFADGNLTGFCGVSAGGEGKGEVSLPGVGTVYLSSISWLVSAGSILPITGSWSDTSEKDRKGILAGLVQATGNTNDGDSIATACLEANGADSFDVNGVAVLLNTGGALVQ